MSDTIAALTQAVRGRVITPSDSDYDDARAVHNGMHDRRPHAVIQCMDSADVMAAVAAGRDGRSLPHQPEHRSGEKELRIIQTNLYQVIMQRRRICISKQTNR
jgi:hypothetical protein